MRMYDCHVRLGNTTSSEVQKRGVTAAEIIVLRHIHGLDAVVRIIKKNQGVASNAAERERLRRIYECNEHTRGRIQHLFGPDHMPLPQDLDPETEAQAAEAVEATEQREAAKDADVEDEINRRVEKELAKREALQEAAKTDEKNLAVINSPIPGGGSGPDGRLSDKEMAARDAKRQAGRAKQVSSDRTAKAQAEA